MAKKGKPLREKHRRLISIGLSQEGGDGLETLSQKADEAMLRGERYFQTLIENALDAVAVLGSDGKIRYESPSFGRILGYEAEEMVGRGAFDLVHADDMLTTAEQFERLMNNPELTLRTKVQVKHKDGTWHTLEVVGRNLLDDPVVAGIVANFRDITEQRRMEEALREGEKRLGDIAENSREWIWEVDTKGKYTYSSPIVESVVGYTPEEILEKHFYDLFSSDDQESLKQRAFEVFARKEPFREFVNRNVRKDGKTVWLSTSGIPLLDNAGNLMGYRGSDIDITERKGMEEALRESELVATATIEGMSDGVMLVGMDGKVSYVNKAFERILGHRAEELVGTSALELPTYRSSKDRDKARKALQKVITTGYAAPIDMVAITKDGKEVPISFTASVIKDFQGNSKTLVAVLRDVSECKEAEEELRRSEKYFRSLIENAQDAIVVIGEDVKIVLASPAVERMLGYKPEELVGTDGFSFVNPDDMPLVMKAFAGLGENPDSVVRVELRIRHKDGLWRVVEAAARNLLSDEAVKGIVVNWRDVTERKEAYEDLRRSEECFRALTENALDAIVLLKVDGTVTYEAPSVVHVMGYSPEELVGKQFLDFVHPDDMSSAVESLTELVQNPETSLKVEVRGRHRDGSWRVLECVCNNLSNNPAVGGIVVNFRDVTERRRAEERIRLNHEIQTILNNLLRISLMDISLEKQLKLFLEQIFTVPSLGLEARGAIFLVEDNPEVLVLKAQHGLAAPLLSTCARVPFGRCLCGRAAASGKVQFADCLDERHENRYEGIRGHGHYCVPILADGKVLGVINLYVSEGHGRDEMEEGFLSAVSDVIAGIIQRKKADEALGESEERFRRLVDQAPDIIFRFSAGKGLEYCSPIVSEITGYTPEELLSEPLVGLELARAMDLSLDEDYEKAVKKGASIGCREIPFKRKDGRQIYLEMRSHAVRDKEGKVIAYEGILRDMTERKRMEEEVRLLSDAVRMTTDSVAITDMGGRILDINEAGLRMYGLSDRADFVGRNPLDAIAPEDRREAIKNMAKLVETGQVNNIEYHVLRKDGSRILIETSVSVIIGSNGEAKGLVAVARDITERKRMEESLRESEARYRLLADNVEDVIFTMDMNMKTTYVSPSVTQLTGFSVEEALAHIHGEALLPTSLDLLKNAIAEGTAAAERGQWDVARSAVLELGLICRDGSVVPVEAKTTLLFGADGKSAGVLGVVRDIRERKKAGETLRVSEERYRLVVEHTSEAILVIQDGRLKFFNSRVVDVMGYSREEIESKTFLEFIHPDDQPMILDYYTRRFRGESAPTSYIFRVVSRDGNALWVENNVVMFTWEGRPATLNFLTDITERRNAEEEKKKMEEQLHLAGRLAAVGELSAGVAHELNNPLAAIQGYAQFLTMNKELEESVKKDVEIIYREAQRASRITQNLLSFARRHEPAKSFVSLNDVLEKTLELRTHQMKVNNIELVRELAPDLPNTMADFYKMQEIFLNIVVNAEQAMTEAHGKGKLVVRSKKTDGLIQIGFTDDGPGISEENMNRIFDPFFTTKEVGKGTGLGLSICFGIVEAHGGRLYARSKLGEGTTFFVEIPIVEEGK